MSRNFVSDGGRAYNADSEVEVAPQKSGDRIESNMSRNPNTSDGGRPYNANSEAEVAPQKFGQSGRLAGEDSEVPDDSQKTAGVVQANGQIVDATPGEPRSLSNYLVYKPNTSTPRVWSGRETIYYYRGDEAMYALVSRNLQAIRWVQIMSWTNNTSATHQYQIFYKTELKITEGSEVSAGINVGASYEGMSIGVDVGYKTFKSTETTTSKTLTLTVNVPPYSELAFYQKRYEFQDWMVFVLDSWGQEWNVGSWGGYDLTSKAVYLHINAEEYLTTDAPLPAGPGSMSVKVVNAQPRASITRKRENCTEKCKSMLAKMGA